MKNLVLNTGTISLSTQGTKVANCISQNRYIFSSLSPDFIEWFIGFTDAEGCFLIAKIGNNFAFRFIIKLHKDDINLLNFIKNSLGDIGNVTSEESVAYFKVTSLSEIKLIIEIFSTYSLNSSKHLDFLAFHRAYLLYTSNKKLRNEEVQEIIRLKYSMNSKRTDYEMSFAQNQQGANPGQTHKIHITGNWLLGFVEGDGSFFVTKQNFILTFSIGQKGNLPLMIAIQSYLYNLDNSLTLDKLTIKDGTIIRNVIYLNKSRNKHTLEFNYVLTIKSKEFLNNVLIPYLDCFTFHSKKKLDYLDWKSIGKLKNLGLHYLPEGKKLIELILSQMNNNRLSTSGNKSIDRHYINSEIMRLLNGPSNYKIIKGKVFIKSLNKFHSGRVKTSVELRDSEYIGFKLFDSMNDCAKFLGVSTHTVSKRMKTNIPVIFNDKKYFIIKSFNNV